MSRRRKKKRLPIENFFDRGFDGFEGADDEDPFRSLLNLVAELPQTQQFLDNAQETLQALVQKAGFAVDRMASRHPPVLPQGARRRRPPQSQGARVRYRPRPPPRAKPAPEPRPEDPLVVMGFPVGARPSRADIKDRQRKLAILFHPDHGGGVEAMQRLNSAAQALLAKAK